jgi:hypothetical protein
MGKVQLGSNIKRLIMEKDLTHQQAKTPDGGDIM